MKLYSLGFMVLSVFFHSAQASHLKEEYDFSRAPSMIPWTSLKNQFSSDKSWQEVTIDDRQWHFHWHNDPKIPIETLYPPQTHKVCAFKVSDSSRSASTIGGKFIAYQLGGSKKTETHYETFAVYTFYLSVPETCTISNHKH